MQFFQLGTHGCDVFSPRSAVLPIQVEMTVLKDIGSCRVGKRGSRVVVPKQSALKIAQGSWIILTILRFAKERGKQILTQQIREGTGIVVNGEQHGTVDVTWKRDLPQGPLGPWRS